MALAVGDIVEVVCCSEANREWLGRCLIVTGSHFQRATDRWPEGFRGILTAPPGPMGPGIAKAWHPSQLRLINPPDWEAPRVRETELIG